MKMIRYLAAIESALTEKLRGNIAYGLLAKNPLSPEWRTCSWTSHFYTLDELADSLDLRGHPRRYDLSELNGVGRNCEMFEGIRKWAYKEIRKYWSPNYYDIWMNAVLERCESINRYFLVFLGEK